MYSVGICVHCTVHRRSTACPTGVAVAAVGEPVAASTGHSSSPSWGRQPAGLGAWNRQLAVVNMNSSALGTAGMAQEAGLGLEVVEGAEP